MSVYIIWFSSHCNVVRTCVSVSNTPLFSSSCRLAALAARRGEGKMPSPSFTLDAQLRFHDKWLKIDLQVCEHQGGITGKEQMQRPAWYFEVSGNLHIIHHLCFSWEIARFIFLCFLKRLCCWSLCFGRSSLWKAVSLRCIVFVTKCNDESLSALMSLVQCFMFSKHCSVNAYHTGALRAASSLLHGWWLFSCETCIL